MSAGNSGTPLARKLGIRPGSRVAFSQAPENFLDTLGELPEDVEVRVWDSTAELRYLILPERPAGTEKLSEDELAALVTRDAMVGVARVRASEVTP